MEVSTNISFQLAKGLIRYRVREQLNCFRNQNIWETSFFIDRIDLSSEVFDYQNVQKDDHQQVEVHELLEIVKNEFQDFILVEDIQQMIYIEEAPQKLECESCKEEHDLAGISYCPVCQFPNFYKLAEINLSGISQNIKHKSKDPIVRQVLLDTEQWRIEDSYTRLVTTFESFFKNLNIEAFRVLEQTIQNLSRRNLFQNIDDTRAWFLNKHQRDIFCTLSLENIDLLKAVVNKRHVIAHNAGLIDGPYVRRMNIEPDQIGKPVPVRESEILQAIQILHQVIETSREMFS